MGRRGMCMPDDRVGKGAQGSLQKELEGLHPLLQRWGWAELVIYRFLLLANDIKKRLQICTLIFLKFFFSSFHKTLDQDPDTLDKPSLFP